MRKMLMLFLLFLCPLSAQNLIWERDTLIYDYIGASLLPSIIDNNGDIVTLIDEGSFNSFNYHFAKYNLRGDLLNWKTYFENPPLCPMNFYETYDGYRAITQRMETFDKLNIGLPTIVEFSKHGDTLHHYSPYISTNESYIDNYSSNFSVTPNPAAEYIEIGSPSIKWGPGGVSEQIKIYNTFGECVSSIPVPTGRDTSAGVGHVRIDVSGLPKGMFFIRIGAYSDKFVVLR